MTRALLVVVLISACSKPVAPSSPPQRQGRAGVSLARDWVLETSEAQPYPGSYTKAQSDARYCKLTGCTMTGALSALRLTTTGASASDGLTFAGSDTARITWQSGYYLNVAAGILTLNLFGGLRSASGYVQADTYLQTVGTTASSLPTCAAGTFGAIETNTDNDGGTVLICDHTVGYQWHYAATSNYASGPVTMIAQKTQPRIEFYNPINGSGGTQLPVAGGVNYGNGALLSPTNATIGSGFGTTPSITANGANAFTITVGNPTGASGVVTLPTAANGWNCFCEDITTHSTTVFRTRQTASTTTSCTVGNFNNTPASANWVAADVLRCIALAY